MSGTSARDSRALLMERLEGDIVLLTLNRPEANNAVSFDMWRSLAECLSELEYDTPARAVVLQGANNFFSTGGDMKIPPAGGAGALSPAMRLEWGQKVIARLRALPIPVIAAVERGAYGMGWSIALACDLIFAARDAKFGAPFVDFGLTPDGGSAWFLTRRVGRYRAAELTLTGRTITADEADRLGLISQLCEPGGATANALSFAENLGRGNRQAVELTKRLLNSAEHSDLAASHELELAYCAILQGGDELKRAKEAFTAARRGDRKN